LGVSRNNRLVYFRKWVIERLTYRYLSVDSGQNISTLKRLFKWYLINPPKFLIRQRENVHLLIDGTYFSNDLCLVLYRDNDIGYTQLYRFSDAERFEQIETFAQGSLKKVGSDSVAKWPIFLKNGRPHCFLRGFLTSFFLLFGLFQTIGHEYPRSPFEVVGNRFHDMLGMHFCHSPVSEGLC